MTYILSWTTKKHQKPLSRTLHSKLKNNSRTFQWLPLKFKDLTVWTLCRFEETQALIGFIYISFWNLLLQKTVQVSGGLSCQGQLNVKFAILIIYSYWVFSTSVYSIKFNLFVTWLSFFMIKRDQFVWPNQNQIAVVLVLVVLLIIHQEEQMKWHPSGVTREFRIWFELARNSSYPTSSWLSKNDWKVGLKFKGN